VGQGRKFHRDNFESAWGKSQSRSNCAYAIPSVTELKGKDAKGEKEGKQKAIQHEKQKEARKIPRRLI